MAVSTELMYANINELCLDPRNPRLGREYRESEKAKSQDRVLDAMSDWTLDELAVSYLESGGFWTQEALLVVNENLYGEDNLVVVEGNRRLAALKYLKMAYDEEKVPSKWNRIAGSSAPPPALFDKIPYLLADQRKDIESYLGFRHVTGIKEWKPKEKADFIAKLIDEDSLTYEQVMRKIGSKTPTVRQNYISHRLLLQIEDSVEDFPLEYVEERFSVMYLSLRTKGVQQYLHIDIQAEPGTAKQPVPKNHIYALKNFAMWLFGDKTNPPLFTDSRQVDNFGRILESEEAVDYLENTDRPNFELAYRRAGGDEKEIARQIRSASDDIELALSRVHLHKSSSEVQESVRRFGQHAYQLLSTFPTIRSEIEASFGQ